MRPDALLLGIETSCDETAAAVVRAGREVLGSRVHTQVDLHAAYGGIVPELASRDHLARVLPVVDSALGDAGVTLADLDGIAVTSGPGLIGALLVGLQAAKGLAAATGKPLIGVNHLEGHLAAVMLEPDPPAPPFLGMVVSGGHTSLYLVEADGAWKYTLLGRTLDDAAGEAFDKIGRLLGLSYPAGRPMDLLARSGNPKAVAFPRGMRARDNPDFSFSGLKTAARLHVEKHGVPEGQALSDLCASVQEAIVDPLVSKALQAARRIGVHQLVVSGGVAANSRLRAALEVRCAEERVRLWLPSIQLCTDNAAMIAAAGHLHLMAGERSGLDLNADPGWRLG